MSVSIGSGPSRNRIIYSDSLTSNPLTFSTENFETLSGNLYAPLATSNFFFWRGQGNGLPSPWYGWWQGGGNPGDSSIITTSLANRNFEVRFVPGTDPELDTNFRFISRWDLRRFWPLNLDFKYDRNPVATIGYQVRTGSTVNRLFTIQASDGYNLSINQGQTVIFTSTPGNLTGNTFWMYEMSADSTAGKVVLRSSNVTGFDVVIAQGVPGAPSSTYVPAIKFNNTVSFASGTFEHNNLDYRLVNASDYRLKTNVRDLDDAWAVLDRIKPRLFHWKTDVTVAKTQGFIAHEVQEVLPQDVGGSLDDVDAQGDPLYQMMDPAILLPYLVAGVRDLDRSLSNLRQKAENLGT